MSFLSQKTGNFFFDPWESESQNGREKFISEKLNDYVNFAKAKVPFYRERLKSFDPKAKFPLQNIPVLTSDSIRELLPPKSDELLAESQKCVTVFQSGGTTGSPKTTLFSHEELDSLDLPNARGFFALGLSEKDRVANLFAVGGLYMTFVHINRMLQQFGCMNFPFSNQTSTDFVLGISKLFKINCFAGITSVVMTCLRKMVELGVEGLNIEKVFFGGEHIYEADRNELTEKLGVKLIAAPGYGTVDTWYIGYQCMNCPPSVFHAHDDQTYIEIVDEESGGHCVTSEVGMLYATPFVRRLTPIIRYLVGDRASWVTEPCPCGRTTPLFKLHGRGDEVLRIGYDSIDYNFVQAAVTAVGKLSGAVQMEKLRVNGKDRLIIRAESTATSDEFQLLVQSLETRILTDRPALRGFIEKGTVLPLRIELFPIGTLPRNPRTGKLIRVIDVL